MGITEDRIKEDAAFAKWATRVIMGLETPRSLTQRRMAHNLAITTLANRGKARSVKEFYTHVLESRMRDYTMIGAAMQHTLRNFGYEGCLEVTWRQDVVDARTTKESRTLLNPHQSSNLE